MGFLGNPLAPEQASAVARAFLSGAENQAAVNAANEKGLAAIAVAHEKAYSAAVTANEKISKELRTEKIKAAKETLDAKQLLLTNTYNKAYDTVYGKAGDIDDAAREVARQDLSKVSEALSKLGTDYGTYVTNIETKDPTTIGNFDFDTSSYVKAPETLPAMGVIPATKLATEQAGLQHTNLQIANLLDPTKGGKITEKEKLANKTHDEFIADVSNVNTQLDAFNSKYQKNADPKTQQVLRQQSALVLNSYRGLFDNTRLGKYDASNPMYSNVAKTVQKVLGAKWNHPSYANDQVDVLNRYFLSNPAADPDSKKAATELREAIIERVPQYQAITPYFNQVEEAPR